MSDLARFWPDRLGDELRAELEAAYSRPGYHDRQHLSEVLHHVDELMAADDPAREAVLLAAWFHDVVYDGQGDDEERSARLAHDELARTAPDGAPLAEEVARLVRLTATHRPGDHDRAGQVLCDADLAVLAADPERYAAYVQGVRTEYAHVSDADFAAGRAAVLRELLAKPTLFHTDEGRGRWERAARANVEREVGSLDAAARPTGAELAAEAYAALVHLLDEVGEEQSWDPTACTGWAVRDLTYHCLTDAQRALVALHTPAEGPVDRDAVSYWQDWAPDEVGAARGRRYVRVSASMFLGWDQLRALYVDTARAVVHAVAATDPEMAVRTQGHVLRADDLLRTLCVEATIHHLDLVTDLVTEGVTPGVTDGVTPGPTVSGPTVGGLAEVRRTLDGLLGGAVDVGWSDERYARVATGRAEPTVEEARALGPARDRLPLFA